MGDDDNGTNKSSESETSTGDFGCQQTQIFDSQLSNSPTSSSGTLPFDDTVMFEDELATQVTDPDGETQLVNVGDETQVVNYDAEIKVMDILDFVENNHTQLLDCDTQEVVVTDHEGTEETEVVDDTDEMSDGDSGRRKCTDAEELEQAQHTQRYEEDRKEYQSKADCGRGEQRTSGVRFKAFTAIRAASIRASGLAARNKASQGIKSSSCSTLSSEPNIEHRKIPFGRSPFHAPEGIHPADALEKHNKHIDGPETENRCRFGSSAVRKLFAEDPLAETRGSKDNANLFGAANSPMVSHFETELAGLSYIDSQEPGEASQANALDFVDNFLKVNIECNDGCDIIKSTGGKLKPVLSAKGTQTLAKNTNLINAVGERGIFDWDDNREDDGGGEFFRKKKEVFFASGGPRPKSSSYSRSGRKVGDCGKKQLHIREQVMGLVCSDSKLVLGNHKANDKSENCLGTHIKDVRKKLIKEFDKPSNLGFEDGTANMPTDMDIQETIDVRFDTQMAAEAMEGLCFGAHGTGHDSDKADEGCNYMPTVFQKGKMREKAYPTQSCKRTRLSNAGIKTKQSKLNRTGDQSKEATDVLLPRSEKVRKQRDIVPAREVEGVKSAAKKNVPQIESENLNNAPPDAEKRRGKASLKRREVDRASAPVVSTDQMSIKKQCIQGKIGTFTPIACRTRQSMRDNESEKIKGASSDFREENILTGFYPKGKRTCQKLSARQEAGGQSISRLTRSKPAILSNSLDICMKRKTSSSLGASPSTKHSCPILLQQSEQGKGAGNHCSVHNDGNCQAYYLPCSEGAEANSRLEGSPKERIEPVASACITPINRGKPVKESSPICMGDEYLKQSCRKSRIRSSLIQELCSLAPIGVAPISPIKDTRKRRDMSLINVVFSRHLDGDIVKQQKKILSRLGASESSSMADATHFIADEFVRTRNMLEAIALGKPVVTHLWLESCGEACCHIDEKIFILRDAKKEKEFGFSLPDSLAHARRNPLLKGHRVLITSSTKPGKEILASLVKAVHGVVVERIGRTALKDNKVPDELLVLSCEEDYAFCLPFLEKGAAIYSSELLLNGIVSQKLEYERHRLFSDRVKRTRSTIWLKKDNQYKPVAKER